VENFDLRPSSQCILASVIPSRFRFVNISLRQVNLLSRCKPRYITSSCWGRFTLCMWIGGHVSLREGNVKWADLYSIAIILHFFSHFCIACRLVCSSCEAMPGSLSAANTAVSSATVAVVDSVDVGRSVVCSRYNSDPSTLSLATPVLTGKSSVCSDDKCMRDLSKLGVFLCRNNKDYQLNYIYITAPFQAICIHPDNFTSCWIQKLSADGRYTSYWDEFAFQSVSAQTESTGSFADAYEEGTRFESITKHNNLTECLMVVYVFRPHMLPWRIRVICDHLNIKNAVFWDVTPCGCYKNRRFGGSYRLHQQGKRIG
jgi:hypothetical protein